MPDQGTAKPNSAINRVNDRTSRVNAWLNDETRQDASERIEPETVAQNLCKKLIIATVELRMDQI